MPDIYVARLIRMIEDEVNNPRWEGYPKPCDYEIDQLLNNISAELGLSVRFYRMEEDLLRIDFNKNHDEVLLFPELVARFREEYPYLVEGPSGCL